MSSTCIKEQPVLRELDGWLKFVARILLVDTLDRIRESCQNRTQSFTKRSLLPLQNEDHRSSCDADSLCRPVLGAL